jgi:hypothetical protein
MDVEAEQPALEAYGGGGRGGRADLLSVLGQELIELHERVIASHRVGDAYRQHHVVRSTGQQREVPLKTLLVARQPVQIAQSAQDGHVGHAHGTLLQVGMSSGGERPSLAAWNVPSSLVT